MEPFYEPEHRKICLLSPFSLLNYVPSLLSARSSCSLMPSPQIKSMLKPHIF